MNQNEFNITLPPVISYVRNLRDENCQEFNTIVVGVIELKGKVFRIPPSIEIISATVFGTGTELGYVNHGDQEHEFSFNVNVPNFGTLYNGRIRVYMPDGTAIRLEYNIQIRDRVINGDELILNF